MNTPVRLFGDLLVELVPHCASVRPHQWTGEVLARPLSPDGFRQAGEIAEAMPDIDAICSSPALRCLQTVQPLAKRRSLPTTEIHELIETQGFAEPREWTEGTLRPVGQAVGGAWAAGGAIRAFATMAGTWPGGHVVACSHGDVILAFLATVCAVHDVPLPDLVGRGGWYTLRFGSGPVSVAAVHPPAG